MLELFGIGTYKPIAGARAGDVAPEFTLKNQDGVDVTLKSLHSDKPLVLAFYPRANSPICTKQMCSLRDHDEELRKRAKIIGISYSSVANMRRFIKELGLKMEMLSDVDKLVARKYGAYGWFAPARVTFVIDKAGVIRAVISSVSTKTHAEQVLAALDHEGI